MPANIYHDGNSWQAWYADKPAWHGKGTVTDGAKTATQVIRAVPAFGKPIMTTPIYVKLGKWVQVPDRVATYRKGNDTILGIVSTEYEKLTDADAVHTTEAVIKAAREERVAASFVTAGLLGKGERAFVSIDLSRIANLKVRRDPSKHQMFLFATWRHDGLGAYQVGLWRNRVECQNMLDAALSSAGSSGLLVSIRHTGDLDKALEDARRTLGLVKETAEADTALMNALQAIPIRKPHLFLPGFTEYVIPDPEGDYDSRGGRALRNRDEAREVIKGLFMDSPTLVGNPNSAYRAYQAAAEYGDHYRPLRVRRDDDEQVAADRRFRSITEGPSADIKARALDYIRQEFEVPAAVAVR